MPLPFRKLATELVWRVPLQPGALARREVVLMYHGVPRSADTRGFDGASFEAQVKFLIERFAVVPAADLQSSVLAGSKSRVCLTFDDGFRNNAEVAAPILHRLGVPAVFFVSTRHLQPGKYLWFAYLEALESYFPGEGFELAGKRYDMSVAGRRQSVASLRQYLLSLRPHPAKMYEVIESQLPPIESFTSDEARLDQFAGMTVEQLASLAANPLFTIGGHTVDHPMLTQCESAEAARQMGRGKLQIEEITGKPCNLFAYPSEAFDGEILAQCRRCGFTTGFSVHRQVQGEGKLVVPRMGVYYPPVVELGVKVRWSSVLRRVQQWSTFPQF